MATKLLFRALIAVLFFLALGLGVGTYELWRMQAEAAEGSKSYPAPRYPKIPKITTIEPLRENALHIVTRPMAYSGNQFPGWEAKKGEKVLMVVSRNTDPLVIEAFLAAFQELNSQVDVLSLSRAATTYQQQEAWHSIDARVRATELRAQKKKAPLFADNDWLTQTAKQRGYDRVVGVSSAVGDTELQVGYDLEWVTREMLASPAVRYPYEIITALDYKTWQGLRTAEKVTAIDPEGTDLRFTWFPEYWEAIEGTHPKIKTVGYGSHVYGAGRSEIPLISSHLMGYPLGVVLEKSDGEGVVAGCHSTEGPHPAMKVFLKNNEITRIEGGGLFGDKWKEFLQVTKDILYPTYPRAGSGFLVELALGTHPKVSQPHNVLESRVGRRGWGYQRNRSGIFHVGLGQILASRWAEMRDLPGAHNHIQLWFATYRATNRDGKEITLVDRGHLTALDDPEIKQLVAKFGDPAQMLAEEWIPAIPGINAPGDYGNDYAPDPVPWMRRHLRQVYGDLMDFKPYP